MQVPADRLPMFAALVAFLSRLHSELNGPSHQTCLLHDNLSATLLEQIVIYHFENHLPIFLSNAISADFEATDWEDCLGSVAILILEDIEIYQRLVDDVQNVVNVQTVMISSSLRNLVHMSHHSSRLLFLEYNHYEPQIESNASLRLFSWRPGVPNTRNNASELLGDQVWNRDDRRTQIFWGNVKWLAQVPIFYFQMVPPEHINSCDQFDSGSCFVYGPHVLLAKLIAHRLCDGRDPIVMDIEVDYSVWYRQFFNSRLKSADFNKLRNTRDAVQQHNHREKPEQSQLKLYVDYVSEYNSRIPTIHIERIVMVVPKRQNEFQSDYFVNVMRFVILLVISCLTTFVSTMLYANEHWKRYCQPNECQHHRNRGYAYIVLDTWARALGNSASSRSMPSLVECILFISLATFAILAGSFLSGELMENMVNVIDVDQIETLKQFLTDSSMMIRFPLFLFNGVRKRSMDRGIITNVSDMQSLMWAHNTSTAYVMPRSLIGFLSTQHMHYSNGAPVFHLSKQIIAKKVISFTNMPWYLVDPVNSVYQCIFEAGLKMHVQELARFMFGLMNEQNLFGGGADWTDSSWDFLWYGHAIGLGFAGLVWVSELILFKWQCM